MTCPVRDDVVVFSRFCHHLLRYLSQLSGEVFGVGDRCFVSWNHLRMLEDASERDRLDLGVIFKYGR